ncbi:inositol monophosphatase family protein [Streptomyces sp. NPDC091272]|uniref:inositol monophosphatase family protein n=1 Tax=Streptomyces sp. NPDC091272 TaxID=3365981 RepID=UPI0037F28977
MWIDEVTDVLREAAAEAIVPRHRALGEGEITEKTPGEVVTVADRDAEALITRRLRGLRDVPVVGEEAVAATPALLAAVAQEPEVWLVDPLDGTANFVAGRDDYAVMAALVSGGQTVASWILQPATGATYTAERGSGAWRGDGVRLLRAPAPAEPGALRGAALTGFLSPRARAHVESSAPRFARLSSGTKCAGVDYPRLAEGALDFLLHHRTLPWDHAPGALLATEAGCTVLRPDDASGYRPDDDRSGLLSAADPRCWRSVRPLLLPASDRPARSDPDDGLNRPTGPRPSDCPHPSDPS